VHTKSHLIQALIVVFGLIVYIVAQLFGGHVNFGEIIAELGLFIAVIVSLHWLYEVSLRRDIAREISATALAQVNFPEIQEELRKIQSFIRITDYGLTDVVLNSRELPYASFLNESDTLIAGFHWSADWINQNAPALRRRAENKKQIILLLIDTTSSAAMYLSSPNRSLADIKKQQDELVHFIRSVIGEERFHDITVKYFASILTYSFVQVNNQIWIRFYKNAEGYFEHIPAFSVAAGSALHNFFDGDIKSLLAGSR
jgi:hypothetical protein